MKAAEIVDATLAAIKTGQYQHARINIANGDMVGHTGNFRAAVMACEVVDLSLNRLLKGLESMGGVALVTADHGNCEQMFEQDKKGQVIYGEDGRPKAKTSHTVFPVPLTLFDPHQQVPQGLVQNMDGAGLANLPATILDLLGFQAPSDYQSSLIQR